MKKLKSGLYNLASHCVKKVLLSLFAGLTLAATQQAVADQWRGSIKWDSSYFKDTPTFTEQNNSDIVSHLDIYVEGLFSLSDALTFEYAVHGVLALNTQDDAFFDAQKFHFTYEGENWESKLGLLDERWGVLDAENLADIFNQRDIVSDYQGDIHLGQFGIGYKYFGDEWSLELLATPRSRARRLSEKQDRYRVTSLPFTAAEFEDGRSQASFAGRYFTTFEQLEFALSFFIGHSREPEYIALDRGTKLMPFYRKIQQSTVEFQQVVGEYVLRSEVFYRSANAYHFNGVGLGIERIFYSYLDSSKDLMVYIEGYWDDRPSHAPTTFFDQDILAGVRLSFNNAGSTELDIRMVRDVGKSSLLVDASIEQRIWQDFQLEFQLSLPLNTKRDKEVLAPFRQDSRFKVSLTRYF